MAEFRMVPVAALEEPAEPDRRESVMVGMDELVADIKAHGLLNPICVEDLEDGRYRVFAGHRRSIAVTILQLPEVMCHVFQLGEPAIERMKAAENMKRTQLTETEEAAVYRRVVEREGKSAKDIALYFDRPLSRVTELIDITYGDERVLEALSRGDISRAQAVEINKWDTPAYRALALEQAVKHGLKADGIRRWRRDVHDQGGEANVQSIIDSLQTMAPTPVEEPMQVCTIKMHAVPLRHSRHYVICSDCMSDFIRGMEMVVAEEAAENGRARARSSTT